MNLVTALCLFLIGCKKPAPPAPPITPEVVEAPASPAIDIPEDIVLMAQNFQRVFFDIDSKGLSEEAREALSENVVIMQENATIRIEIQGHADERGTTEYNMALGASRASAVADYMTANGIGPSRLRVNSLGEERPIAQGASEVAWSKNRRCEFIITFGDEDHLRSTTE